MDDKQIIAIEIGSSKIKGAIGSVENSGTVTVKAVEEMPLIDSVRYGQLGNVGMAASTLRNILQKIDNRVAPRKVVGVYVSVGGRSLTAVSREVMRRLPADTEVTDELIARLKHEALGMGVPGLDVLGVEPRGFSIDDMRVENPVGMYGSQIKMDANLIVCRPGLKSNLPRLFEDKLNVKINGYVVRQTAIADLVLTADEMKLGCMLVDFGAETTTVSIYKHGRMQYLATLPLGSRNITRDIMTLNYVEDNAENLKITRGSASIEPGTVEGESLTSDVNLSELNNYVAHRAAEIIINICEQRKLSGFSARELPAGIIIVGGGNKLNGFNRRLEKESEMPVRIGTSISTDVRIADGRISPIDAVDVIAILLGAARMGAKECLTEVVEEPEPEEVVDDIDDFEQEPTNSGGAKSVGSFLRKVGGFILGVNDGKETEEGDLGDDEDA